MANDTFYDRRYYIQGLLVVACIILLLFAAHLQLLNSSLKVKADSVVIGEYVRYPARGLIYDRDGKALVVNRPMYDLLVTKNQVDPRMDTLKFCQLLGIDRSYFEANMEKNWSSPRFSKSLPYVFLGKISFETFARFQESLYQFPGFEVQRRNARVYPYPSAAGVLGYIREVNESDIERYPDQYEPGDYIGASGIEQVYEQQLRGKKGASFVLKNNLGKDMGPFAGGSRDIDPVAGSDITVSLDIELQRYGEKLMQNKVGGIVAIEPQSGEILSMITSPSYNPQDLMISNRERGQVFSRLQQDSLQPLFNRSTMAQYPPGSLFKPILALIALQEEVIDTDLRVSCPGGYTHNGRVLTGCHNHPTCTSVEMAIQHSCNAYFVHVFRKLVDQFGFYRPTAGVDTLNSYLQRFGMGRSLDIDFPYEKRGNLVPGAVFDTTIYRNENWNSLWIRSMGIGQGEFLATNLQLANIAAAIANRGYYFPPHLVKYFRNSSNSIDNHYLRPVELGIDDKHFEPIVEGMHKVVTSGTARRAYISDIDVCGKTGTAENPHGEDHSIFFAFAPKDDPQIAIVAYVENAGFGGTWAAPIASLMIEQYLKGEIRGPNRKWLEQSVLDANFIEKP